MTARKKEARAILQSRHPEPRDGIEAQKKEARAKQNPSANLSNLTNPSPNCYYPTYLFIKFPVQIILQPTKLLNEIR